MNAPPACQCCLSRPRDAEHHFHMHIFQVHQHLALSFFSCTTSTIKNTKNKQNKNPQSLVTQPCGRSLSEQKKVEMQHLCCFSTEASLLIWTAELGIASVVIIASGRVELFLKELPAGQRAAPKRKIISSALFTFKPVWDCPCLIAAVSTH